MTFVHRKVEYYHKTLVHHATKDQLVRWTTEDRVPVFIKKQQKNYKIGIIKLIIAVLAN